MKKSLLSLALLATTIAFAQSPSKVDNQPSFDYNRNSLTVIPLVGFVGLDNETAQWAQDNSFDGKFDVNKIQSFGMQTQDNADAILNVLKSRHTGKEILNYWLQYDGKYFYPTLLEQRSRYNATDADVLNAAASKINTLSTSGRALMNSSYIMVAGPTNITTQKDKKGNITYYVYVQAYVYHLNINDSVMARINNCWLTEDLDPNEYNSNKAEYDNLDVEVTYIAYDAEKGEGKTKQEALISALGGILEPLEKQIDPWQVVTSIYKKHPLRAKIGKKEGLSNSDRYAAYKVIEDEQGNIRYKKVGFVRATKVANNTVDANGESACSKFYQISGRILREGEFLKQKKDAKMIVSGSYYLDGSYTGQIDLDMLASTSQVLGTMQYGGISLGYAAMSEGSGYLGLSLNYGIGIHPVRIFEIEPYIGIGADCDLSNTSGDDDNSFFKSLAYFAGGGVKVSFQVWYPVSIFVRGGYNYLFAQGEKYEEAYDRFGKVELSAGIKINF